MATYTGTYLNDVGRNFKRVALSTYLIDSALQNDSRINTDPTFDINYLPAVLLNWFVSEPPICSIIQGTRSIWQAKATISPSKILYIPCPFVGNSSDFNTFFSELVNNPLVLFAELSPETINGFYLHFFSKA